MRYLKVENNIVTDVIIAPQSFIEAGHVGDANLWIFSEFDGAIGFIYDPETKTFIPPTIPDTQT